MESELRPTRSISSCIRPRRSEGATRLYSKVAHQRCPQLVIRGLKLAYDLEISFANVGDKAHLFPVRDSSDPAPDTGFLLPSGLYQLQYRPTS